MMCPMGIEEAHPLTAGDQPFAELAAYIRQTAGSSAEFVEAANPSRMHVEPTNPNSAPLFIALVQWIVL